MNTGFTNQKCPRCGGNLYLDTNYYIEGGVMGWYDHESCLQCGYIRYEDESSQSRIAITTTVAQRELLPV
jgi:hypothetical protein